MEALNIFLTESFEEHCCNYKNQFIIKTNNNTNILKFVCTYVIHFSKIL